MKYQGCFKKVYFHPGHLAIENSLEQGCFNTWMSINSRCWKEMLSQLINAFILFSLVWFLTVCHSRCYSGIIFGYIPTPVSREEESKISSVPARVVIDRVSPSCYAPTSKRWEARLFMNQTVINHTGRKERVERQNKWTTGKRKREFMKLLHKVSGSELFANGSTGDKESSSISCWEAHRPLRGKQVTKLGNVTNNISVCFPCLTISSHFQWFKVSCD